MRQGGGSKSESAIARMMHEGHGSTDSDMLEVESYSGAWRIVSMYVHCELSLFLG